MAAPRKLSKNRKEQTMKKKEDIVIISNEKTEEKIEKKRVKRNIPEEQKILNDFMHTLRKNAYHLVKCIATSKSKEAYITRLDEAFQGINTAIATMQGELLIESKFANMTDAEREFLKKMFSNN